MMNYKITKENLAEENMGDFIDERQGQSFVQMFMELKDQVEYQVKKSRFTSIESNYCPIFLYEAMKRKVSLEDFESLLKVVNYEKGLHRFFERSSYDYADSLQEDACVWSRMSYFFYKQKGKQIVFDEKKLPYIKAIMLHVHENNLLDFHSSRIDSYLTHVIYKDPSKLDSLFEIMANNPLLLQEEKTQYVSLPGSIIGNIAAASYEKDVSIYYHAVKSNPLAKQVMDAMVLREDYRNELELNLSLVNMLLNVEPAEHVVAYVHERFNQKARSIAEIDPDRNQEHVYSIYSGLSVIFRKKHFELDCSLIDLNKPWKENYVYLCLLGELVSKCKFDCLKNVNKDVLEYVKMFDVDELSKRLVEKKITHEEFSLLARVMGMESFANLEKMVAARELQETLPEHHGGGKRVKM